MNDPVAHWHTEHVYFGQLLKLLRKEVDVFHGGEEPLFLLRKMIVSKSEAERRNALNELSSYVKKDVKDTLTVMNGRPVTIRLLGTSVAWALGSHVRPSRRIGKSFKDFMMFLLVSGL